MRELGREDAAPSREHNSRCRSASCLASRKAETKSSPLLIFTFLLYAFHISFVSVDSIFGFCEARCWASQRDPKLAAQPSHRQKKSAPSAISHVSLLFWQKNGKSVSWHVSMRGTPRKQLKIRVAEAESAPWFGIPEIHHATSKKNWKDMES